MAEDCESGGEGTSAQSVDASSTMTGSSRRLSLNDSESSCIGVAETEELCS